MPEAKPAPSSQQQANHSVRASLVSPERTFRVEGHTLHWEDGKGGGALPLKDVSTLRLSVYPGLNGLAKQCVLKSAEHPRVLIRSDHYRSLGAFEDRSATYAPLVRLIIERSADTANPPRYLVGSRGMWFVWLAIFLIGLIVVLPAVGWMLSNASAAPSLWLALVGLIGLTFTAWLQVRRENGKVFDPENPPEDYIR